MCSTDRIRQLVSEKPGMKAGQIADELGLDRPEVLAALHGPLAETLIEDNAYRWWPASSETPPSPTPEQPTLLARLCRYYLECLAHESGTGISLPLSDTAGYAPLAALPFVRPLDPADRALRRLAQKARRERGQLALYVGYALRLRARDCEEPRIEPVLLYPLDDDSLQPAGRLPLFNLDVLKSPPSADSGNLIDEAIHLAEDLGLANAEDDLPSWDEIALRLARCRPEWDWREPVNPYALSAGEFGAPGIYNRAVLFAGTRSPFTYGLETELRKLAQVDEASLRETALGAWLRGDAAAPPAEDRPILELLPLNSEQRQAVVQGLAAPLTVVTGPPGTGKSQVVAGLLANLAWQGSSVLFSSKNNHAVDVVESRVNALGSGPVLLRLGREEHHARIAQHLTALLAEAAGTDDAAAFQRLAREHELDRQRFAAVQQRIASVVELRNQVDELERAAESARAVFGPRFTALRALDLDALRARLEALSAALEAADESAQSAMVRLLWDSVKSRRLERVAEAGAALLTDAAALGLEPPVADGWSRHRDELSARLEPAARAQAYLRALDNLLAAEPLEHLACELTRVTGESAHNSRELWQAWLRLRPARWTREERRLLGEYVSLLQIIAGGDRYDEGAGRRVFRRYYSLFPQVARTLPCWAVTSLSARGRLPFEPAIFDLVVIDEASQCDIASALPLLYRARRAVIIGDPLQLRHVSTLAPRQDRLMLSAHGLADAHASWAYSVNSLFDLARALCGHEDIVNLREHHRSHRDIIAFSNLHFYRGRLRVATDHENLKPAAGPAVRWMDVKGKVVRPSAGGALNAIEAEKVLGELRRLVLEEGYDGAIGVVTPFRAQANRIRTLVHQDPELARALALLQFVVDTVHGFQGDERDMILFSPVVSHGTGESTLRFLKNHGNLFNVAVTRARSELVVVGDRQAALDSGVGYLADFAAYARDLASRDRPLPPSADVGPEYPAVAHPEQVSGWERIFYKAMYAAGLRPVPQYQEAPYSLDFALFEGERKLDIEIDGENYHRGWDGELCRRDQLRSRRLADRGWDILRLWVYQLRDDPEGSLRRVRAWTQK